MIILFGNQKGGCGKTTNCIQFANYLVEKGKEVLVLDLDFQRSLSDRRKEDIATYDNEPKYEVIQTDISNVAKIISDFTKVEQGGHTVRRQKFCLNSFFFEVYNCFFRKCSDNINK